MTGVKEWMESLFANSLASAAINMAAIVSICYILYRCMKHVLYRRDVTNKESIADILKGIFRFIAVCCCFGQIAALQPVFKAILSSSGIIAIIVGIAAQETVGNVCSGIMILFFKPFVIGDLIKVNQGELIGYVEEINFRHTIIRTYESNRVIIPNSKLNSSVIENAYLKDSRKDNYLEIEIAYGADIDSAIAIIQKTSVAVMKEYRIQYDAIPEIKVTQLNTAGIMLRAIIPSNNSLEGFDMLAEIRYRIIHQFSAHSIEFSHYDFDIRCHNG